MIRALLILVFAFPAVANAQVASDFRDPDPETFSSENARPLLADRNGPQAYPTLEVASTNAIDGADAAGVLAQKAEDRQAQALFTALARMDCRIAERDMADRLGPLGFDPEAVSRTLSALYIQGVASFDSDGNLALPASVCPPNEAVSNPRDTVLAALRDNGCTATERQMRAAPGISDLSEAQLLAILGPMRDRGDIEIGTLSATLSPELCQED